MDALNRYGPLVGRLMIAAIFVVSGFGKITGFDGTVGYIASKGLTITAISGNRGDHCGIGWWNTADPGLENALGRGRDVHFYGRGGADFP